MRADKGSIVIVCVAMRHRLQMSSNERECIRLNSFVNTARGGAN
jgi:hypothetical protein